MSRALTVEVSELASTALEQRFSPANGTDANSQSTECSEIEAARSRFE
jgi:hypothetical protein